MIAISTIDLYNLLKEKIGEQQAKALTEYVEQKVDASFENAKENLGTKKDLYETKAGFLKWMIVLFAPFYIGMIVFLIKQFM